MSASESSEAGPEAGAEPDDSGSRAADFEAQLGRYGDDLTAVIAACHRATSSGDEALAAVAHFKLGVLLHREGDTAGALAAYRAAVDSGHPDVGPKAANNLGILLMDQNDAGRAMPMLRWAVDSGHAEGAPRAALNLARLLEAEGDAEGAKAALGQAMESGNEAVAPFAAMKLGLLCESTGDTGAAKTAFEAVVASGDPTHLASAAAILGRLLAEEGDVEGADAAYERVARLHHASGPARLVAAVDPTDCGRRELQGIIISLRSWARARGADPVELDTADELLRHEARRAGFVGGLHTALRWQLDGDAKPPEGSPASASASNAWPVQLARSLELLVPGISVKAQQTRGRGLSGGLLKTMASAVSGLPAVVTYTVDLGDAGPPLRLTVPDRPDLLPEAIGHVLETVISVRRRFGSAVYHVRQVSFDHSDQGLKTGKLAGTAHTITGDVHLNAWDACAEGVERYRFLHRPTVRTGRGTERPFERLRATTAHELWHNIEGAFKARRYEASVEFRRQLGAYFDADTLEHVVEAKGARVPAARRQARARLLHEVSAYAGTNVFEATAELFSVWWCSADEPSPVARHFGDVVDRFFPRPSP